LLAKLFIREPFYPRAADGAGTRSTQGCPGPDSETWECRILSGNSLLSEGNHRPRSWRPRRKRFRGGESGVNTQVRMDSAHNFIAAITVVEMERIPSACAFNVISFCPDLQEARLGVDCSASGLLRIPANSSPTCPDRIRHGYRPHTIPGFLVNSGMEAHR
jgi:hypothetical protein